MSFSVHDLSASQRAHIIRVLRAELDRFGGLPGLWRRHRARVADRLAEQYDVPPKDVLALWNAWVDNRRQREWDRQRAAFLARIAAGMEPATSGPESAGTRQVW